MRDVSAWPVAERLRYHAARFAYRHRWEFCPHEVELDGQRQKITWAVWFKANFGMSLDEYQSQLTQVPE